MRGSWSVILLALGCSSPGAGTEADDGSEPSGRVIQISAGMSSTCVLTDTGGVRCWGENFNEEGILGYGMTENIGDDDVPADWGDLSLGEPAVRVSVGPREACAILESGLVRCWGDVPGLPNTFVGDDETPDSNSPVDWPPPQPVALANGGRYHCAVGPEGVLGCTLPLPQLAGDVASITAGNVHACVLLEDGGIQCWGNIGGGVLGYPGEGFIFKDIEDYDLGIVDVGEPAIQVVAGSAHTCALLKSGDVRCWGPNWGSALGYGTGIGDTCGILDEASGHDGRDCGVSPDCCVGDDEPPSAWPPVDLGPGKVVELVAGSQHTCALMEGGTVRCWGHNDEGALGYRHTEDVGDDEPAGAFGDVPLDRTVVQVAAGTVHTCALTDEAEVYCWGYNGTRGRLGQGYSTLGCVNEKNFEGCASPKCCLGDDESIDSLPPVRVF